MTWEYEIQGVPSRDSDFLNEYISGPRCKEFMTWGQIVRKGMKFGHVLWHQKYFAAYTPLRMEIDTFILYDHRRSFYYDYLCSGQSGFYWIRWSTMWHTKLRSLQRYHVLITWTDNDTCYKLWLLLLITCWLYFRNIKTRKLTSEFRQWYFEKKNYAHITYRIYLKAKFQYV